MYSGYKLYIISKEMEKIVLNLLDNGIDYILEAVSPLFLNRLESQQSLKYSILHLYSGIELLLKERLRQEHWSLIFQDVSSADPRKLKSGDFVSIYHGELVKRLKGILNIDINDKPFKILQALRNRFEHFEVRVSVGECKETIALALDEIISFWDKHLIENSTVEQQKKFGEIKSIATSYEEYKLQRLKKFETVINKITESGNGILVVCPSCQAPGFIVFKDDSKECKCYICDEKTTKIDYLKNTRKQEQDNKVYSLLPFEAYDIKCSSCGSETRIRNKISDDETVYYCLTCLDSQVISKQEQRNKEFNEWVEKLYSEHTNDEAMSILKNELLELEESQIESGFISREEVEVERQIRRESYRIALFEELKRRGIKIGES